MATELTVEERLSLSLPAVSTAPVFDLAAWDDRNSPAWKALAALSETDPQSAGNLISMWRVEVGRQGASSRLQA